MEIGKVTESFITKTNYKDKIVDDITDMFIELKDAGLILVDQISPRIYVLYVGHTRLCASEVKRMWVSEEDADE